MSNLLTIERAFLSLPQVKQGLKLAEFKTLQRNVENAQKKKFDSTLDLSKVVLASFEWFKSTEGQSLCNEEGISWTAEDFGNKVFGFQKSYFYKLTRAGKLATEVVEDFKRKCTELESEGETPNRSLEGLLKYAKELETATETSGQGEDGKEVVETQVETRTQVVFSLTYKIEDRNLSLKIDNEGRIKITGGTINHVNDAIEFLYDLVNSQSAQNNEL